MHQGRDIAQDQMIRQDWMSEKLYKIQKWSLLMVKSQWWEQTLWHVLGDLI